MASFSGSSSSPTPTPERKTLLSLPPEILISCLLLPSRRHYQYYIQPPLPPKNVLLVSRYMYRIAAPYLCAHLWVGSEATDLGESPLIPFLTAKQRSAFSLPSWQRMADPAWVHEITILPRDPHTSNDARLCQILSLVLPAMKLRSMRWEGRQNYERSVARVVEQQKGLENICCRVGCHLWHSGLKGLKEIVSWHDKNFPYDQGDTRTGLLQGSAETVQTLHLAVGYVFDGIGDVARLILKGVETMPKVRILRLTGFNKEALAAIERVVAFGSVEEFQIARGVGLDGLRGKDLSSAHSLAGNATTRGLVELLNGCGIRRLRDLRVKFVDYNDWEDPPADHEPLLPNMTIIDALGRHGAALTSLTLIHDNSGLSSNVVALREKEVARLVEYCPSLECLSIKVELGDIIKISPLLAKLTRLSQLSLRIIYHSPVGDHITSTAPYHLPPSNIPLWSIDNHWFGRGKRDWAPFPPTAITPLEVVMSHLLAAGLSSIQSFFLSIGNTNPMHPDPFLANRYEMRPGTRQDRSARGPGDFLNAPAGHRYAWGGGEFVVISRDRFNFRERRKTFVLSSHYTSAFEDLQILG